MNHHAEEALQSAKKTWAAKPRALSAGAIAAAACAIGVWMAIVTPVPVSASQDPFNAGGFDAWRAYTGTDGETHFERIHLTGPAMQQFGIADAVRHLYVGDATSLVLIVGKPGFQSPAHNVGSGRELGLVVRGSATAFFGKGESREFHAGDLTLFEDTGSRGRSVRFGPDGYVGLTIPLAK